MIWSRSLLPSSLTHQSLIIKHPTYVGVPNSFFNTKMYVQRMYLKRGSIGVRTQNICFQEEKPIVGRSFSMSNRGGKWNVPGPSVLFYMRCVENFSVHFNLDLYYPGAFFIAIFRFWDAVFSYVVMFTSRPH